MNKSDEHQITETEISSGIVLLKKRQTKLSFYGFLSAGFFAVSLVSIFIQSDVVYSYFGLTQSVEQLHIPYSIEGILQSVQHQKDYFFNLLSWLGWFIFKIFCSIIGAFIAIHFLKKIRFFYTRFHSFILKFVAWLIAVIVIWSGMTFIQYDLRDDESEEQYELVSYEKNIQDSAIAQLMRVNDVNPTVKTYVLAQTALLHQPVDKNHATALVSQLVQAERVDKKFFEYGFSPEQIWSMQNQVYGKSVTPVAQSVENKVSHVKTVKRVVQTVLITLSVLFMLMMIMFYFLATSFKNRIQKIQDKISF